MRSSFLCAVVWAAAAGTSFSSARTIDFLDAGGIPSDKSLATHQSNGALVNKTLAAMQSGDTLVFRADMVFHVMGGIFARDLQNVVIQLDGILRFWNGRKEWPIATTTKHRYKDPVMECIEFVNFTNFTLTSETGNGTIDGRGIAWWGAVQYARYQENRPRLMAIKESTGILIEKILLKDSPYWTLNLDDVVDVEIGWTNVSVHWDDSDKHTALDIQAFNTDGFDVAGKNVWIHDCNIWNDDDCIAVKDLNRGDKLAACSENMLFERISASGLGLTIGSIGASADHMCVRNITFRDCYMKNTVKGLYLKSRWATGPNITAEITDITYENIVIDEPEQYAIWIGPAQQADSADGCSFDYPSDPKAKCPVPAAHTWNNLVFRNITINKPGQSPGVILGNSTNVMKNVVFEDVVVNYPSLKPLGHAYYVCENVEGVANGSTWPVPPCFVNKTHGGAPPHPQPAGDCEHDNHCEPVGGRCCNCKRKCGITKCTSQHYCKACNASVGDMLD